MGYAVLHLEKTNGSDSGMTAHIERTISPKNADPNRTHLNKELIQFPEGVLNRTQAIQQRLDTAGLKRKIGKNQVRAVRILLTGSPDDMKQIEQTGKLGEWCNDNLSWLAKTFGKENIVSAVLHMDETTPHIHATMTPILAGERRKKKTDTNPTKKKYRTKNIDTKRLCADDVMSRVKLKEYQNTYAEDMRKYGLQRGIDGSEAKHISTSQYYRDLLYESSSIEEKNSRLLNQQKEAEKQLSKAKRSIIKENLKNSAANVGTKIMDGAYSILGTSKVSKLENQIENLNKTNELLRGENKDLYNQIDNLKQKHEKEQEKLQSENKNLKSTIDKIFDFFPNVKELLNMEKLCRGIGFGVEHIKSLFRGETLNINGTLYSDVHKRHFKTDQSIAKITTDKNNATKLSLNVDGQDINEWFKDKYKELKQSLGIKIDRDQKRGFRL